MIFLLQNFKLLLAFIIVFAFYSMDGNRNTANRYTSQEPFVSDRAIENNSLDTFSRKESLDKIRSKIDNDIPLVVHVRIPLCDNLHQGIVPVSRLVGDGLDLRNNLYWGAKYGLKNHFRKHTDWKLLQSTLDVNNVILERVVFYKEFDNHAKVYLVADAYRGDKMKECLVNYINSLAGNCSETISINANHLSIGSAADLNIFNGHNGLMDYDLDIIESHDRQVREASVIGCISHKYFKEHLLSIKSYPVLMTTNLMAPEAYVIEGVINSWANLSSGNEIRLSAGSAYNKYQKCGLRGATRLFRSGW